MVKDGRKDSSLTTLSYISTLLAVLLQIFTVWRMKVEITEVLSRYLLWHLHVFAVAIAQISVRILHSHELMTLKGHRCRLAV